MDKYLFKNLIIGKSITENVRENKRVYKLYNMIKTKPHNKVYFEEIFSGDREKLLADVMSVMDFLKKIEDKDYKTKLWVTYVKQNIMANGLSVNLVHEIADKVLVELNNNIKIITKDNYLK